MVWYGMVWYGMAENCEATLINYARVKAILVLDQRFLANELSVLGTIYRVTLLTLQVSVYRVHCRFGT